MILKGKVALVTGGAKRIGRVIALALADVGANVVVHYSSSRDEAEKTAAEVSGRGVESMAVKADLAGGELVISELIDSVASRFGCLDILVNNASIFMRTPLATVSEEAWDRTMEVNLKGSFFCSLHSGRRMAAQEDGGAIINIVDSAISHPYRDYAPYFISKAGVVDMTRNLARALAPKVRVNAVAPGPLVTPRDLADSVAEKIRENTPLKRHCTPQDVAAAVVFLLEDGDYITGEVITVDGGRSLVQS